MEDYLCTLNFGEDVEHKQGVNKAITFNSHADIKYTRNRS